MFSSFNKNKKQTTPSDPKIALPIFTDLGIEAPYIALNNDVPKLILEQVFYWRALEDEGVAYVSSQNHWVLPWSEFYELQRQTEHQDSLKLLQLPSETSLRPVIRSKGALTDSDFGIMLEGWKDQLNQSLKSVPIRTGGVLNVDGQPFLLKEEVWLLTEAVRQFYRLPASDKNHQSNELAWSKIRRLAIKSKAGIDDFLRKTIVLSPEKLRLDMRKNVVMDELLVELQPTFENAPLNWLEVFDDYHQVQNRYSITLPDGGVAHVLISPEVKEVLHEIKQMPQRRVTGERARALLRNPFTQLGEQAAKVLSPKSFEESRDKAEIFFYDFDIQVQNNEKGRIDSLILVLQEKSTRLVDAKQICINNLNEANQLLASLYQGLKASLPYASYRGFEIEINPNSHLKIEQLSVLLVQWSQQLALIDAEDFLDLSKYSDRVLDIGEAVKLNSPFIQKDSGESGWVPELQTDVGVMPVIEKVSIEDIKALEKAIEETDFLGSDTVTLPNSGQSVDIYAAKDRLKQMKAKYDKEINNNTQTDEKEKNKSSVLIIKSNIDTVDYGKERALALSFDAASNYPKLPKSLRDDVQLKDHQLVGVAWLQHLQNFAPTNLNGCLLADDMGLGKTLQLLTFIGHYLETSDYQKPILIIAPVSLLDNWVAEIERFFDIDLFGSVLKLYGSQLADNKVRKADVPLALRERGVSNLLKSNWRNKANIVLTTYETLRDLEFSFAVEDWGIMICDEAQKIKTPSALVTQAAKAQKADFKIACTGTPVENSLTDLWCLFDFIQPSLLGALNEFGRNYRRPIESANKEDVDSLAHLKILIEPQILRRTKQQVAKDLPPKIEVTTCKQLPMSALQKNLYQNIVQEFKEKSALDGEKNSAIILTLLHKMRSICAHPLAFSSDGDIKSSPKIVWLFDTLNIIREKNDKVIIFTEFRDIQSFLQRVIYQEFGLHVITINGDTNANSEKGASRQQLINIFQDTAGFNVIILSTTAVGFGVNVQSANHVIHFTRCWNPAKEDQASDRAYRIGQKKDVYVYYPTIYSPDFDTFEVKLDRLLNSKRSLANDMLNGTGEISIQELARDILN